MDASPLPPVFVIAIAITALVQLAVLACFFMLCANAARLVRLVESIHSQQLVAVHARLEEIRSRLDHARL